MRLGFHIVGKLNEEEREIALMPFTAPVVDERSEKVAIFSRFSGIRFSLIPDGTLDRIVQQRGNHGIIQAGRFPADSRFAAQSFHLYARFVLPCAAQVNGLISEFQPIGFVFDKAPATGIADNPHGKRVLPLFQNAGRHIVPPWGILIADCADKLPVDKRRIGIHNATQQQFPLFARHGGRQVNLFPKPHHAIYRPAVFLRPIAGHVHLRPVRRRQVFRMPRRRGIALILQPRLPVPVFRPLPVFRLYLPYEKGVFETLKLCETVGVSADGILTDPRFHRRAAQRGID
ncbi:hypothetical protein Barb7_02643 [Bacteroidales bacterium Barb7]|nr:hypothetical protein Barb7_02643 [Bacteroidales bacterium Barb7]